MGKAKIGDILRNDYCAEDNLNRYTLVAGFVDRYYGTLVCTVKVHDDGAITETDYKKETVDHDEKFKVVGHVDIEGFIRDALRKAKEETA